MELTPFDSHGFFSSLAMIIASEIGDKTFLVAALLAMKHDRLVVFGGAFAALVIMSVLSGVVGHSMPALLPDYITKLAACGLFLVFGAKLCYEGYNMDKDASVKEEMAEVEHEIQDASLEDGQPQPTRLDGVTNLLGLVFSPVFLQTFTLTFLGEWGDRSQIATIAMAAGSDYWWVILGTVLGHSLCTLLAVLGGRMLASQISVRTVTLGGGALFLLFGLVYLYEVLI
jgi:putative Ca2+/H+ antiporter (TMEM165/GDT1 family)